MSNSQLQDQNTILKAQISAVGSSAQAQPVAAEVPNVDNPKLQEKIVELESANSEKDEELEKLRKDQEDLLELLTDQDVRLNTFKNRLRELGETIDDGDSDNNDCSENES